MMTIVKAFMRTRRYPYSSSLSGRVSSFSSGQNTIDEQIEELNQELEAVFGPLDDSGNRFVPSLPAETPAPSSSIKTHALRLDNYKDADNSPGKKLATSALSHVDVQGKASMVDVSEKPLNKRVALASGKVILGRNAFLLVAANQIAKGDVLTVAKLAGIYGAKQTANLVPLCHNITLSNVEVNLELDDEESAINVTAQATAVGATGVEMEALTAVSVAALTIYDMCKAVSKHVRITNIQLESKTGGKSGEWCRRED